MRPLRTTIALVLSCAACASMGTGGSGTSPTPATAQQTPRTRPAPSWPVKTREHVDLWLHGFAMLQADTTLVPFFKRGYRNEMTVLKNQANATTQLDVNLDRLRARLSANSSLVNAQFLPLYFNSLDEMRQAIEFFVQANGSPQAASSQQQANVIALLASYFPTAADRAWLSLFTSSTMDEDTRFYHSYWLQQQRARGNVIDSVTSMWQNGVRPRLQRFLNNTQQRDGTVLLSLPLDGEGRTLNSGTGGPTMAVTFPARPSDVPDAIYVIVHEVVSRMATQAITDNTTPAEQRNGIADRLASPATVRAGLMLLERAAPELADGYARYYLTSAGRTVGSNPRAQIVALFSLPDVIRDAITRQLDLIQGGI